MSLREKLIEPTFEDTASYSWSKTMENVYNSMPGGAMAYRQPVNVIISHQIIPFVKLSV